MFKGDKSVVYRLFQKHMVTHVFLGSLEGLAQFAEKRSAYPIDCSRLVGLCGANTERRRFSLAATGGHSSLNSSPLLTPRRCSQSESNRPLISSGTSTPPLPAVSSVSQPFRSVTSYTQKSSSECNSRLQPEQESCHYTKRQMHADNGVLQSRNSLPRFRIVGWVDAWGFFATESACVIN